MNETKMTNWLNESDAMMRHIREEAKIKLLSEVADEIHDLAKTKGWWREERNNGELLMLIVSELGEACEGLRSGNGPSDHIPDFSACEEELADAIIRILDMSAARGWKVPAAIFAKMRFNETRTFRHGGKKF